MHGKPMMFNSIHLLAWTTWTCVLKPPVRSGIQLSDVIVVLTYSKPRSLTSRPPSCENTNGHVWRSSGNWNWNNPRKVRCFPLVWRTFACVEAWVQYQFPLSQTLHASKCDWRSFCSFCFSVNTASENIPMVSDIEHFHSDRLAVACYQSPMVAVYQGLGMV